MNAQIAALCEGPVAVRTLVWLQSEMNAIHVSFQGLLVLEQFRTFGARNELLPEEMDSGLVALQVPSEFERAAALVADVRPHVAVDRVGVVTEVGGHFERLAALRADVPANGRVHHQFVSVTGTGLREPLVARPTRVRSLAGVSAEMNDQVCRRETQDPAGRARHRFPGERTSRRRVLR